MTENMKTKAFKRRGGCDEDCMNCPYPDCYKPTMECKTDIFVSALLRERPSKEKSALHMFTVELGGTGTNRPNLSRKFYL